VWSPYKQPEPNFRSRHEHAKKTPRHDRWAGGHHRKHWGTIYPDEIERLAGLHADVLVTHEAPLSPARLRDPRQAGTCPWRQDHCAWPSSRQHR
jgi:hypothetical protein